MIKKYKLGLFVFVLLAVVAIFVFFIEASPKGKNSLKNRAGRFYVLTTENISIQSQHYWYVAVDFFGGASNKTQIGWVSDIHADIYKRRTVDSGTLYPRQFSVYLPNVFEALRKQKITTVIATGDNANSGDADYSERLVKMAYAKNMKMLWVKGNHDKDPGMEALGFKNVDKCYYFDDFGDTRVVVVDDSQGEFMVGGVSEEQIQWLKEVLKTDKKVIVAMHIPIFPLDLSDDVMPHFVELEKIFHDAGNVKVVINGHFHTRWKKQFDDIDYYGQSALTRENEEGGYGIIDLKNLNIGNYYSK